MPREQINKLCNSYTMEHHTVKKNTVPHKEISKQQGQKGRVHRLHYINIKTTQNKTIVFTDTCTHGRIQGQVRA